MSDHLDGCTVVLTGTGSEGLDSGMMTTLLCAANRLQVAESAEETVRICRSQLPEIVVVRHHADFDGFALTKELRALIKPPHVILIGEDDDVSGWRAALESGAAAYIPAPNLANELQAALDRISTAIRLTRQHRQRVADTNLIARTVDVAPYGMVLVDLGGLIVAANPQFCTMVSIAPDQLKGLKLSVLLAQLTDEGWTGRSSLADAIRQGTSWQGDCRWYCSRHREGWATLQLAPLDPQGEHLWSVLTVRDSTEEHQQRSRLVIDSAAARDLLISQGQIDHGELQVLNGLLLGIRQPEQETFPLRQLLADALPTDVKLHLPDCLPEQLHGNQLALRATLRALAEWGRRSSSSGKLELAVRLRQRSGSSWQLLFSMEAEDLRVHENHYESATDCLAAARTKGHPLDLTGLGLASQLVSMMGGALLLKQSKELGRQASFSIWLQEGSGQTSSTDRLTADGTTFSSHEGGTVSVPPHATHGTLRVLLADDSPLDQLNIKNLLQRCGYQVVAVSNGREAVEEFESNDFDLVLMDILMPVMDGFEATRLIREHNALSGRRTPVIALTSYSLKAVKEKCERVGMSGYLAKPISMNSLSKVLDTLIGQHAEHEGTATSPEPAPGQHTPQILNQQGAMEIMDGDADLYQEVLKLFKLHGPPAFEGLLTALQTGDTEQIELCAHKLKGMAANIGAEQFSQSNMLLMEEARNGAVADAKAWLRRLPGEYTALEQAIAVIDQH